MYPLIAGTYPVPANAGTTTPCIASSYTPKGGCANLSRLCDVNVCDPPSRIPTRGFSPEKNDSCTSGVAVSVCTRYIQRVHTQFPLPREPPRRALCIFIHTQRGLRQSVEIMRRQRVCDPPFKILTRGFSRKEWFRACPTWGCNTVSPPCAVIPPVWHTRCGGVAAAAPARGRHRGGKGTATVARLGERRGRRVDPPSLCLFSFSFFFLARRVREFVEKPHPHARRGGGGGGGA